MSDTPRTDRAWHPSCQATTEELIENSRELERELTQAQADLGAAQHELDVWKCMACQMAEVIERISDRDGELLAKFDQLKGVKP